MTRTLAIGAVLISTALALRWYEMWLTATTKRDLDGVMNFWRRNP